MSKISDLWTFVINVGTNEHRSMQFLSRSATRLSCRRRVRLSVCPSHAGSFESKLMTVGSRGFHHWVAQGI